jgi:hypothetical protein
VAGSVQGPGPDDWDVWRPLMVGHQIDWVRFHALQGTFLPYCLVFAARTVSVLSYEHCKADWLLGVFSNIELVSSPAVRMSERTGGTA